MDEELKPWDGFELTPLSTKREAISFYGFQQYSVYKSLGVSRFVLGLPTGTGKTVCSYLSWEYYKTKYPQTKLLVVTNNTAVLQFAEEYSNFFESDVRGIAIHPDMPSPEKTYPLARKRVYEQFLRGAGSQKIDFLAMNYAIFRRDYPHLKNHLLQLKKEGHRIFVIFDEATAFQYTNTATHKSVRDLSEKIADKVLALTATLTKGKLESAYGIFLAIGIKICPSKRAFEQEFCIVWQHPRHFYLKKITGYRNLDVFKKRIEDCSIILRKKDVAKYLPPLTISKVYLQHSSEQYKLISDIYSGIVDVGALGEEIDFEGDLDDVLTIGVLTEQGYIKRALLDPRLVTKPTECDAEYRSPKTEEIIRLLTEDFMDEKVVVYTTSLVYLNILWDTIKRCKEIPDYYRKQIGVISGEVKPEQREFYKNKFSNTDEINLMLINDAGAEAINLQAAQAMVVCNIPKSGGDLVQLVGRISRLGSTHSNLYIHFLLMEESQDCDEYIIAMQQIQLMTEVQGEQEQGLIDWDVLRKTASEGSKSLVSVEELRRSSMAKLIYSKRKRRAALYKRECKSLED